MCIRDSFLRCSEYENVVLTWVMHRQEILDELTRELPDCETIAVSLLCTEAELRRRLERDIDAGLREPDVLERAAAYLPLYSCLLYTSAMYPKVLEDFFTHRKEYGYIMRMGSHVFFNGMAVGETTQINIEDGKTLVIKYLGLGDRNEEMCIRDRS